ncbi:DUF3939 domain-containing protein [Neobacillus mesonae]|uniref:DUF3939 domain-containing protein n=1 Tax=Neobacillus mesonae TaxID=1193713 RepID=UPI0025725C3A|nr:DUF3939 domain-containing protein [Neobacillus mesonae]
MNPLSFSWIFGIIFTVFVVYFIIKFFTPPNQKGIKNEQAAAKNYPTIDVTLDDVRMAIRKFSERLPKGVYRTILVEDDHSIDFHQLAPILGGIPTKKFYMSKETYDLFEEDERHIPPAMDMVQKAVDLYVEERKEFPMLSYDPQRRVNYYQLLQEKYLKAAPEIQFYITELDGLITHNRPEKKGTSQS